jgi:hypothetical protein
MYFIKIGFEILNCSVVDQDGAQLHVFVNVIMKFLVLEKQRIS